MILKYIAGFVTVSAWLRAYMVRTLEEGQKIEKRTYCSFDYTGNYERFGNYESYRNYESFRSFSELIIEIFVAECSIFKIFTILSKKFMSEFQ